MLSPATPLSLAFLAAFVLLLLSTLSTPVIPSIPLGSFRGYNLGVFGYCKIGGQCGPPQIGYNTTGLWPSGTAPDHFSTGTRNKLSFILIVHPIAAFLVLTCTILATAAHFKPGHSSTYLLVLLILTFPTLLVTLLAFLVDILLFVPPSMSWGGWIVLPATLIITACSVVTCAMRRTLVSRKARKERIEQDENMNGSAYYEMKSETPFQAPVDSYARAESPPPLPTNDGALPREKTAQFSTAEYAQTRMGMMQDAQHARDFSMNSNSTDQRMHTNISGSTQVDSNARSGSMGDSPAMPYDNRGSPAGSFESRSRSGRSPTYGPGGPPPPNYHRGRGGPRGPRGGYYGPPRGAYRGGAGPRGPPPPGWNGYGRGGPGPMAPRGRPGPPPGYPNGYYGGRGAPDSGMMYGRRGGRPSMDGPRDQLAALENDPYQEAAGDWNLNDTQDDPISPAPGPAAPAYNYRPTTSESRTRDPASFGFSGRVPSPARSQRSQTAKNNSPPPPVPPVAHPATAMGGQVAEMDAAEDILQAYAGDEQGHSRSYESEAVGDTYGEHSGGTYFSRSTYQQEPAELDSPSQYVSPMEMPVGNSPVQSSAPRQSSPRKSSERHRPRISSDDYYEDMDPRFSEDTARPRQSISDSQQHPHHPSSPGAALPSALMVGSGSYQTQQQHHPPSPLPPSTRDPNTLYPSYGSGAADDQLRDNSRSPAASEGAESNFTSISQRGVNPEWHPSYGWSGNAGTYAPAPGPGPASTDWRSRERDQILQANPDFAVPGAGPGRAGRTSMEATTRQHTRGMSSGAASGGSHRYPDAI